jgi:hypothetical protein
MINSIDTWTQLYHPQEQSSWCGVSVTQMTLLAAGIEKSQAEIAKFICKNWFGTPSTLMLAYLSKFFKIVNYKAGSDFRDLSFHLKKDHVVIVNWWDDIDNENESDGGHYSIIGNYDGKKRLITIVDPCEHRGIWNISTKEFRKKWYDYLDMNNRLYVTGWMSWIDLNSKIE